MCWEISEESENSRSTNISILENKINLACNFIDYLR